LGVTFEEATEKTGNGNMGSNEIIDYPTLTKIWAKSYMKTLTYHLQNNYNFTLTYKFIGIWSPKEYNFKTDEIVIELTEEEIDRFIKHFNTEKVNNHISEKCKFYVSFYPTLKDVKKEPCIHARYIFRYLYETIDQEKLKDEMNGLHEELSSSRAYDKWYKVYDMITTDRDFKNNVIKQLNKLTNSEPTEYTFGSIYTLLNLYDSTWEDKKTNKDLLPVIGWLAIHDNEFSIR